MARPTRLLNLSPLGWALWLSLLTHAWLLTLHFQPALRTLADRLPALEVMLVNSKSLRAPDKADALAQANLDRGGNTDQKRTLKSPLPSVRAAQAALPMQAPAPVPTATLAASPHDEVLQREKQRVVQLEQEARELLTQLKASQRIEANQALPTAQPKRAASERAKKQLPVPPQPHQAAMQEMVKLEALIAKQQETYEMRPKRQFIGARTREYRFATYVDQWRQNIERVGNLNYPQSAKLQKLYGRLQMTVSIKADGSIESIRIHQSSGHKLLDDAARRIVQMAAPFPRFSPEIRQDTDVLSITRTWIFTRDNQLATTE